MHSQDVYSQRRAQLSADKQALLDRRLHALAHVEIVPEIIPPCPVTDDGLVAASFAQQRLWFLQELEPENVAYNESIAIRMQGPFHLESYTRAYQDLVGRHEVLHSTFALIDGQVIQRIHPVAQNESCVTVIDLTGQSETERDQALQDIISQETQRPFYLSKERPWRTFLLRLAAEEHISLTVMHHIITDGWSMTIFFEELSTLYAAYSAGRTSPLPENITHYSSYAHWQRERLARGDLEKQRVYWQQQMKGPLPILELPQDHTRPAQQTYHGSRFSFQLPPELGQKLTQFGFQEGATLFMVLLSAFEVLLYRYSGQEDIVVGSPVAGRTHPQLESTMGCFVNTLVLRNNLAGNPSFRDLLRQVRKVTLEAFDAQDFPFEKLVEDVQPERDLRRNPIFQTFFVLQNTPPRHVQHDDQLIISRLEIPSTTTKFDLLLNMEETDGKLGGFFEYNTDLFDAGSIERMQGHFRHILETCASNPDQGIASFGLLSRTEYQQQVVEWNATDQPYMLNTCLHHLVEAQVERSPSAEAVRFQQEALTYQELNRRANQLANYLREQGVGPDVCVGVYLERSLEMVVALLGVLKAGGAYVPIDPGYPGERVAFILQNSQVPILLIQEHLRSTLPTYTRQLVALDADWPEIARRSVETPASITGPDHLAYVIYTSGSTGKPKGAMNTHRAICNRLLWMQETYQLQAQERVLQKTPFSFDVSVWEFFWPLMTGACLVVARPEGHRESSYLVKLIEVEQITTLHFVPSMLRVLLAEEVLERCTSIKRVFCSGESLPVDLQNQFLSRMPAIALYNLYGPTETAVDVTHWTCKRTEGEEQQRSVPIGRPIANTRIYLLDAFLNPVPVGVTGELYIGGVAVGRGYLNQRELTWERFLPDPFSDEPGATLYKTGDLARFWPDGTIEYLGRNDFQIKIRGFRIELGEIEAVLRAHPAIRECAILAREDTPGKIRLVAYVVPEREQASSSGEVRSYLASYLPEYMIPAAFVLLEALPLSPNGKLDRQALPVPDYLRYSVETPYVAPQTSLEEMLSDIWSRLLDLPRIGVNDNFFEIGGHSLLLVQLVAEIRKSLQIELPMRTMYHAPTIAGLASAIEKMQAAYEELHKERKGITPVSRTDYRLKRFSAAEKAVNA